MNIYWTCKEEDLKKIPKDIKYRLEHDWLLDEGEGTIVFESLDNALRAIISIYPLAQYSFNMRNNFAIVENFDDHLWELKEYRK
jgi:hypothetical protein